MAHDFTGKRRKEAWLYEELKGTKMFAHPVHALNKDKSSLHVSNISELNELILKTENHLNLVCSSLSPYLECRDRGQAFDSAILNQPSCS
jgi:hypothetical protein